MREQLVARRLPFALVHLAEYHREAMLHLAQGPMAWNLPDPWNTRILQLDAGVQTLGDGVGDRGGAVLAQGGDEQLLLADQRIDLGRFVIQKLDDLLLLA